MTSSGEGRGQPASWVGGEEKLWWRPGQRAGQPGPQCPSQAVGAEDVETGYLWTVKGRGCLPGVRSRTWTRGGASLRGRDREGRPPEGWHSLRDGAHLGPPTPYPQSLLQKQPTRQLPAARIATPDVFVPVFVKCLGGTVPVPPDSFADCHTARLPLPAPRRGWLVRSCLRIQNSGDLVSLCPREEASTFPRL